MQHTLNSTRLLQRFTLLGNFKNYLRMGLEFFFQLRIREEKENDKFYTSDCNAGKFTDPIPRGILTHTLNVSIEQECNNWFLQIKTI